MNWIISPIDSIERSLSSLRKDPFQSGNPELDRYLKQYALKNDRNGISRTFIAVSSEDSQRIAGYYSCCTGGLSFEDLPADFQESLPRYPTPIILIGKLAVDLSVQGRGLGKRLLFHALENALNVSQTVGVYAAKVDAIDEAAKTFYENSGFREIPQVPLSLLLRLETFKKGLDR